MSRLNLFSTSALCFLVMGCQARTPIHTVDYVDLSRYAGDWYVIASIPTPFEKDVYNGLESYRIADDGSIETTFTFNKGGFDGPEKQYTPRAFVTDPDSNAVWGMQFVWPFKAEYRIIYLDDDYSVTVVGRTKRDFVWIMAREPEIPEGDYQRILAFLADEGYDTAKVSKVPQLTNARQKGA